MAERLSKVAREFNVGISTIVEYLHNKKGIDVSSDPNTKLTEEQFELVKNAFSSDSEARKSSDSKGRPTKKGTITIEKPKEKENFISVQDEVKDRIKFKQVDNIDINSPKKTIEVKKVEPEVKVEKVEREVKPVEEKKEEPVKEIPESAPSKPEERVPEPPVVVETPVVEERPPVIVEPPVQDPVTEKVPEETNEKSEPEPFRRSITRLKGVTLTGEYVDVENMNQRTRPPKGSMKGANRRTEVPPSSPPKTEETGKKSPVLVKNTGTTEEKKDPKEKRKRIRKKDERVLPVDKISRTEESKKKLKNIRKKKATKTEITEEVVEKQVKETYASMGSKGKTKASKHRKDKREIVHQRIQAEIEQAEIEKRILEVTEFVTVSELAIMMNIPPTDIISTCMKLGLFVSINQRLNADTILIVAEEFGFMVKFVGVDIQEAIEEEEDLPAQIESRPPIVTVMGHVDHGKTSLLDYIRKANVIAGEAGGITQHIGAYSVMLNDGRAVTFLDTPGHEAFTAMRARGAQVTDMAIIIVAADDHVMPQTVEAINHASAAGVPIVFAINKIDRPGANPEKIKEELSAMNYLVEDWGGKYQSQEISAKQGLNVDKLLEKVLFEAEILELKANPHKKAIGSIIESSLDKGRGYVATVLVQNGTLHVGDVVLAGQYFGRVKAMFNERGQKMEEAGPSTPALILGLSGAPQAGDKFNVMDNEKEARDLANKREQLQREQGLRTQKHITLDEIGRRIAVGNFQELNIIVKGDVDGSIEALSDTLIKLSTQEIQVNVIHKAVGQISEGDVMLAAASNAIIVGFQVRPSLSARKLAEKEQIDIRLYSIIYTAREEIKSAMEGMLSPDMKEEITSTVEVLETFKISKVGTIAGCIVRDGKITRSTKIRVIRNGIVIHTGELGSLKRFKDDVKEVTKGFECGLNIHNFNDIENGDIVESFEEVAIKKTL